MSPIHDPSAFVDGTLWPFKVTCAIILAFMVMDWIHSDDEDPDGYA